jgi:leucyl aminopeptidase
MGHTLTAGQQKGHNFQLLIKAQTRKKPVECTIKHTPAEKTATPCLVLGVFAKAPDALSGSGKAIDAACGSWLSGVIESEDLSATAGATLLLHSPPGLEARRLLLVSLGEKKDGGLSPHAYRKAVMGVAKVLAKSGVQKASLALLECPIAGKDMAWALREGTRLLVDGQYRFKAPRAPKKEGDDPKPLRKAHWLLPERMPLPPLQVALEQGMAQARGMALARDLGNQPGNVCTPTFLATTAREMADRLKLKVEVLERDDMEKLGMGALLSVAKGSDEPPKLIVLHYRPSKTTADPVVLVGKGVTFDSGGISLKPAAEMDEMRYDMCGAAAVFGAMQAAAEMALPVPLIAIVPAVENMPDGKASRPGDVVTSLSGQTIEILNTDAEGRLILCDALTYAERFKPACVIDLATLTGACVVALGKIPSGLLSNDEALAQRLLACGIDTDDKAWQLPLWEEYQDLIKSDFADMANVGGRYGGAITAAAFLSRFTKAYPWAHLDIAGVAWVSGESKGATGRPVALITHFLMEEAQRRQKTASPPPATAG